MTDKRRIEIAYNLLNSMLINKYLYRVDNNLATSVNIPIKEFKAIIDILDDRNYDLASTTKDTT